MDKKWYKNKWVYITLFFCLVIAGVVYGRVTKKTTPQYEFVKVAKGDLVQTVDATGNIEAANEVDLKFASAGRLASISKKTGDKVVAGQILAALELGDLNAAVAQASAGVKKANAELRQLEITSQSAINSASSAVETAKNNLKLAEGGENSQIVQDAYDDAVTLLKAVQNILSSAMTEADNILGIDNNFANDDFESVLSTVNIDKKYKAESAYQTAKNDRNAFLAKDTNTASSHQDIDASIGLAENALVSAKTLLSLVNDALDNTRPIGDLSQSELDTLKTNIKTAWTNVVTKYTSLITQKQAIVTAKNSYAGYEIAYNKAVADLASAKNKADVDMDVYKAVQLSAEATLSQAAANRSKSVIVAPVAGVIGKIVPKVGEYVTSQDLIIQLVSQMYQIKVDVPETDIVKMSLGDVAQIKLDAYGDDVVFSGKVMQIEPSQTVIQDVVYYRVTVSIEPDKIHQIYNGMTANIVFSTEEKQNVLTLPQRAIKTNGDGKYVRVLENGVLKEIPIKVGLRGDGGQIEILEGVAEGQEVVVSVTEAK